MTGSINPEKDINGIIASRYGRKWIARRIFQGAALLAVVVFALFAFFFYRITYSMGGPGAEILGVIFFILLLSAHIARRIKDGKIDYAEAKIEWLKTLQKEFTQERDRLNYGKLASLPWDQHIDKCQQMISALEAKLGSSK